MILFFLFFISFSTHTIILYYTIFITRCKDARKEEEEKRKIERERARERGRYRGRLSIKDMTAE